MRSLGTESIRSLGRRAPAASPHWPLRAGSAVALLVQVAAIGLMTIPAWLLGGIQADTQFWLFVVATCVMFVCWAMCLGRPASAHPLPAALVPLGLAVVLGAVQMVPLSPPVHHWISARTERWWQDLDPKPETASPANLAGNVRPNDARPISLYPASTRRDVYLLALGLSAFLIGAIGFASRGAFSVAAILVALNGAALSFFGLVQQLTWNGQLFWSIPLTGGGVPFASYVNRNNASGFLNICLAGAVALTAWSFAWRSDGEAWDPGRPASKLGAGGYLWFVVRGCVVRALRALSRLDATTVASLTAAACIAAGILCSLSRGGTVAMIGAAAITFAATSLGGRKRLALAGAAVVGGVAACLLVLYLGQGATVSQRLATLVDESAVQTEGRLVHWQDGWRAAQDLLPAGSGLGTYRYVYRAYQQRPYGEWCYHAENQYLEALVEAGLPGLALLLAAIGLVALACWRLLKHAPDAATYALGVGGTFALSSQAIQACFDFGLYLPANMLLLALVCGAVCGRAARIESRDGSTSNGATRWLAYLVALPPGRALTASCCVAAVGVLLLGCVQARRSVAVESAVARAKPLDVRQPHSLDALDGCLARFAAVPLSAVEDVEAQLRLARLWINRLRVGLLDRLRREAAAGASESVLWSATDTTHLHGRLQPLLAQQRTAELTAVRQSPPVLENLPHALAHLRLARSLCPLLPEVHLLLAQLTVLEATNADNQADLDRVRLTAPANPQILPRCGLLELQAGRIAAACRTWRMSLELAGEQLPQIIQTARPCIDLAAHIGDLMPDSPQWILDVASRQFSTEDDRQVRRALLAKADSLLSTQPLDDAQRQWLRGRLALLRNDFRRAAVYFTRALAMRPDETAWRYELAIALKHSGRYQEAQDQAQVCVRTEPNNEQYEALLREVIRAQLSPQRRSGTDI